MQVLQIENCCEEGVSSQEAVSHQGVARAALPNTRNMRSVPTFTMDSFSKAVQFPDVKAIYWFAWVYSKNNISQLHYFAVFSGGYIR